MKLNSLVITIALSILSTTTFAKTLSCPLFLIESTAKEIEQEGQNMQKAMLTIKLDAEGNSLSDEEAVVMTSRTGEKFEIFAGVNSNPNIKGVKQLTLTVLANEKRESIRSMLLAEDGVSSGSGWHLGPKGATQLKMLSPNSLSEKSLDLRITGTAFSVLKAKYGIRQAQEDSNAYSISQIAQEAVQAGDLKEGSALATGIFFGCWEQK